MISLTGVEGIKNLCLPKRCDVCGKKRKINLGTDCVRCSVWTERHWRYLIAKYIRFSMEKYLHNKTPRPRSIPVGYEELIEKYRGV